MLSILVLSTKKQYSSFLKSVCVFQKIYFKVKVLKLFKISSESHMKACRSLKWRAILKIPILKEPMLFLLALKWNLYEKAFSCVKTKNNFCCKPCWNAERSNHSFLIDESHFWNICTLIMWQYIEINWLCEHRKKVRNSQACISINSCTELSKVFPVLLSQFKIPFRA